MWQKGKIYILILGLVAIVAAVGLIRSEDTIRSMIISGSDDAYAGNGPHIIFNAERNEKVRINLFENEEGDYVFFAPGFWNCEKKNKVKSTPGGDITTKLVEGQQKLGDDNLVVLKGSAIHSLMLEFDDEAFDIWNPLLGVEAESEDENALKEEYSGNDSQDGNKVDQESSNYKLWTDVRVRLFDEKGQLINSGIAEELRVRGNTSADWPKKPFQLTMKDSTDFAGLGSAKKWNLLSNWSDKSLMRNTIAFDMAKKAGLEYSPDSILIDLYINGNYQGNYQLCEKIEIGSNRVNISNLENLTLDKEGDLTKTGNTVKPISKTMDNGMYVQGFEMALATDDITGGYLLELERPSRIKDSPSSFITQAGQPMTVKSPKLADVSEVEYIGNLWQDFENALFSEDGFNPATGRHYTDYIDVDSFVKKYLVEEIVRNYDASSTSQYFYKDADSIDGRIHAGPVWDYDMSLGNTIMSKYTNQKYTSSVDPYGIFAALPMDDFTLWYHLSCHGDFNDRVVQSYYTDFLPQLYELENEKIDELADKYEASAISDMMRWGRLEGVTYSDFGGEYRKNVDILKNFLKNREHYLTSLWVDKKQPKKIYLDGGEADMYVAFVEVFEGEQVPYPKGDPELEGSDFDCWLNGYTDEPYDFEEIYKGQDLYLKARFK